jgi:hypothetical protein
METCPHQIWKLVLIKDDIHRDVDAPIRQASQSWWTAVQLDLAGRDSAGAVWSATVGIAEIALAAAKSHLFVIIS